MVRRFGALMALAALVTGFAGAQAPPAEPSLKLVKYAGLADVVRQHRGKVVLVDFWTFQCIPCKKEMPHLVKLQKEFGPEGLVALTVALDDPPDETAQKNCLKFLQTIGSNTINLMLDEPPEVWEPRLQIAQLPHVVLFDRQGKHRVFPGAAIGDHYENVKKQTIEWLRKK